MPDKKSFWTTIPGIITALGGLIGAIAALVTALYTAGFFQQTPKDSPELHTLPSSLKQPPPLRKLPYVIFDRGNSPRLDFGIFESDGDCLDALLATQKRIDTYNASKCDRLPHQVWCVSIKDLGDNEAIKDCELTKESCKVTLSLHKIEAKLGTERVTTSCEQFSAWDLLTK